MAYGRDLDFVRRETWNGVTRNEGEYCEKGLLSRLILDNLVRLPDRRRSVVILGVGGYSKQLAIEELLP